MGDQTTLWVHERKEPNCRCSTSAMMLGWCDHVASNIQRKASRDELVAAVSQIDGAEVYTVGDFGWNEVPDPGTYLVIPVGGTSQGGEK